jgi:hypothetical protein
MENKIKAVLTVYHSKRDVYGNCYYGMIINRTSDGNTAWGIISGDDSNCTYAIRTMLGDSREFVFNNIELPKRQFNRLTANWKYIGCTPDEINANVLNQWNNPEANFK